MRGALEDHAPAMRPMLSMNGQPRDFLGFIEGRIDQAPVPARERFDRWLSVRASMRLMPEWARRMSGTHVPAAAGRFVLEPGDRLKARIIRWAYPEPPCVAMALARASAVPDQQAAARSRG